MQDKFIYQKKDFVNCGVPEGSFGRLIKKLEIDNSDYMCQKVLPNGINAKFFTEEAMQIVLNYLKSKEESKNKNELLLLNQNSEMKKLNLELQQKNLQLQNAITLLESQHTKEISNLKDEWHETEKQLLERNGSLIKEGVEKDRQLFEKQKEIESLGNMNFWQFRKWKKEQRKK